MPWLVETHFASTGSRILVIEHHQEIPVKNTSLSGSRVRAYNGMEVLLRLPRTQHGSLHFSSCLHLRPPRTPINPMKSPEPWSRDTQRERICKRVSMSDNIRTILVIDDVPMVLTVMTESACNGRAIRSYRPQARRRPSKPRPPWPGESPSSL
jgi:hypothetical protein